MSSMSFSRNRPPPTPKATLVPSAPANDETLRERKFLFSEAYCFAPQCNCWRMMLNVIDTACGH